jgi:hydrogenase maturation protein HypF
MPRVRVRITGTVQGVGFRPFVHRLATARALGGWVRNEGDAVLLEVEGCAAVLSDFLAALRDGPPEGAHVHTFVSEEVPESATNPGDFVIRAGRASGPLGPTLPADRVPCEACLAEVSAPGHRRHRYPFTACTRCGPRLSIALGLPWSRERTTLGPFPLCAACAAEYADPRDRRFHAEAMACPRCGPRLRWLDHEGRVLAEGDAALREAVLRLARGETIAVKGLGGFQLLADATSESALSSLRARKHREEKPFALLVRDLGAARAITRPTPEEEAELGSAAGPIVLVRRREVPEGPALAASVAPGSPLLGLMLPATPLHFLLAEGVGRPLVCTSGNRAEEPMETTLAGALAALGGVAQGFLDHDREIARPLDDSVVRFAGAQRLVVRRARGLAPRPVSLEMETGRTVLALGAHLKATVTLALRGHALTSAHLGDLGSFEAMAGHARAIQDLLTFHGATPQVLACDLHPDYASTRAAEALASRLAVPLVRVQHHHAHAAAVIAEHGLAGPVLALVWDGLGLGSDGALWGGEALRVDGATFTRLGHVGAFRLPGGEAALRDPRRVALGLLHAASPELARRHGLPLFAEEEGERLLRLLATGRHAPETTSVGRLFDAVAALTGLCRRSTFEGQAALRVEHAATEQGAPPYPVELEDEPAILRLGPFVEALCGDLPSGPARVASRLHATLVELASRLAQRAELSRVVLGGGVFQNAILAAAIPRRLAAEGRQVFLPRELPPGDGAISLGQAWVAAQSG